MESGDDNDGDAGGMVSKCSADDVFENGANELKGTHQ